ncbi:hypothetical protein PsYK624_026250 [Phanerochaete sordida]|uniref:Heterokaryon incompatibility domain-containing protein n=1 Tax=Phanerochaete sordida TaxID=48140 RepID=A0A9P3L8X3_9APHY|nr:hypothetical protein PsYK624_026250 [Phanerochaete sordida]
MTSPATGGDAFAKEESTDIQDTSSAVQNVEAVTDVSEQPDDSQDLRRRFVLEGTSAIIACEDPPWESRDNGTIVVPAALDQRIRDRGVGCATPEKNRLHLWGMVQLALSHAVPEKILFRSQNADRGMTFTLRPRFRSKIPLQRVHVGDGAIPDVLAGVPCKDIDLYQALDMLNDIMRTEFTLRTQGLYNCLQRCLHDYRDLGEVYGFLRPWWRGDCFRDIFTHIAHRESELDMIRKEAIRGSCIQNSRIPPRHVWDLYANRVLPLQALPPDQGSNPEDIPSSVWCVSHSWVTEEDRLEVWTKINGKRWPVPIPKTTTLDHIRIELLNMGAEYVWLDVLCLRQRGNEKEEAVRQAEWRLDVPTIGYTYSRPTTPCVTYFNGLGLPLDTSAATLESHRQWFNRVWTLQESTLGWLPGGLVGGPLEEGRAFFDRLEDIVRAVNGFGSDLSLAQALRARACTTELDRISGLAYIFRCRTLPIYDESVTQEDAWTLLLKHMDPHRRTEISLHYSPERPFGIWTSWETFLTSLRGTLHPSRPRLATTTSRMGSSGDVFELVDPKQLYTSEHGQYCHWGYVIHPCRVLLDGSDDSPDIIQLSLGDSETRFQLSVLHSHGILLEDISYCLVSLKDDVERWAFCEMIGEREVNKRTVVEVVRWAVIHTTQDEGARLEALTSEYKRRAYLTYLATNEALLRSPCAGEYIEVRGPLSSGYKQEAEQLRP